MIASRSQRLVACLLLAGGLAACSGTASIDTFDLSGPKVEATARPAGVQIVVADPVVDRALDTDRIVVRPKPTEIAYFAGAQWSDRLPRLLQSRLVETLEASGRFRAAGRPGQGMAADRRLVVEIRSFDYLPSESRVAVLLSVKLMDDRSGRITAARVFEGSAPTSGDGAPAVVSAFDTATARVLTDIAAWAR